MMIAGDKLFQNATTAARRAVHQTSDLRAVVQAVIRLTTQRCPTVTGVGFAVPIRALGPRRAGNHRIASFQQSAVLTPNRSSRRT
jgi:hypothetical protein